MTDKWKADPERGGKHVEPRRLEIVRLLKDSADVAFYHIDQRLAADIAALKKKAGEDKQKCTKQVEAAMTRPAMEIVRKYWSEDPNDMWKHFVYNMTK